MKLNARTYGDPNRPLLLVLHALGCHSGWWEEMAPHLTGSFYVVAPDFRGHGDSPRADSYRFTEYAADLSELLAEMGNPSYAIAGHSMGGYVGLVMAAAAPLKPRALTVIDMKTEATPDELAHMAAGAMKPPRSFASLEDALGRYRLAPPEHSVPVETMTRVARESYRQLPDGAWSEKFDRRAMAIEPLDPMGLARQAGCPLHFIRGEHSVVMPEAPARALAEAAGAPLTTLTGCYHHLPLEVPARLAALLHEQLV